jgi:hypothetical protein
VVKIATFAKPENVMPNAKTTLKGGKTVQNNTDNNYKKDFADTVTLY